MSIFSLDRKCGLQNISKNSTFLSVANETALFYLTVLVNVNSKCWRMVPPHRYPIAACQKEKTHAFPKPVRPAIRRAHRFLLVVAGIKNYTRTVLDGRSHSSDGME